MLPVITTSRIVLVLPQGYSPEQKPSLGSWGTGWGQGWGGAQGGASSCFLLCGLFIPAGPLWGRTSRAQGSRDFVLQKLLFLVTQIPNLSNSKKEISRAHLQWNSPMGWPSNPPSDEHCEVGRKREPTSKETLPVLLILL